MKSFENYNPIVIFLYFLMTAGIVMFSMNPVVICISFIGALLLYIVRNGINRPLMHFIWLVMFLIMSIINPLLHHNGRTVLFVLNDNPVTLEALIYGFCSSGVIITVIYWFMSFSQLMTSDRLLYIFGSISPKFALIFSMTLRYIPLFGRQAKKVNSAQKALGMYKDDNIIDAIRGGTRVFSVMVTWALENGIITADSMTARGYGTAKRSYFAVYRFKKCDILFLAVTALFSLVTLFCMGLGFFNYSFYPSIIAPSLSVYSITGYFTYALLCLLPTMIEIGDKLTWQYLKSKI